MPFHVLLIREVERPFPLPTCVLMFQRCTVFLQLTLTDTHLRVGMSVNLSCLIENINGWVEELPKSKTRCLRALTNQLRWFASTQVRNVACLGGNIATASPISDMNPLWLALVGDALSHVFCFVLFCFVLFCAVLFCSLLFCLFLFVFFLLCCVFGFLVM